MRRVAGFVVFAALASTAVFFSPLAIAGGTVPTVKLMLGTKPYPNTIGFGQVKPSRLGYGKSAVVCRIHWDSWGGQIALGTGVGWRISPTTYKRIPSAVVLYLYDLKTVQGKPAYTAWNFAAVPTHNARALRLC